MEEGYKGGWGRRKMGGRTEEESRREEGIEGESG